MTSTKTAMMRYRCYLIESDGCGRKQGNETYAFLLFAVVQQMLPGKITGWVAIISSSRTAAVSLTDAKQSAKTLLMALQYKHLSRSRISVTAVPKCHQIHSSCNRGYQEDTCNCCFLFLFSSTGGWGKNKA